jgi:NADH-quinone oxidoreductase subunit D
MPAGPIDSNPKDIPPGEGIGQIEAPRGECFHYIKSDGTNSPIRHKIRAPTYMNFPTFRETVIGESVSDATIILAAIDPCYCCTERMLIVDHKDKKVMDMNGLVRLSQEKTRRIRERTVIASPPL